MPHIAAIRRAVPSKAAKAPKPRWRRRKDARPEEILAAALEVFADRGFASTKLEDVARRAGVTKGTIYLYFENKEALFKALVRQTIVPVIAQGEEIAQAFTGSARDLFERLVREYWQLVGETQLSGIPRLMIAEAGNFPELARFYYEEVVTRGHRLMAGVLQRGIKAGEFRPLNVQLAAKLAMSPLMHAVIARKAFSACMPDDFNVASYLNTHIDLYLHGIATDRTDHRADKR
jgi:AcrR family transcriptional regulator